jgi:hypothetical protein
VRRLSLLGKILIYKTFGLSQIIYVLTVIDIDDLQYKQLEKMFINFIWGRSLNDTQNLSHYSRISRDRLCTPIDKGGFGMITITEVIEAIRCRQLAKMYNPEYNHPLKNCILIEGRFLTSAKCLTNEVDKVAQKSQKILRGHIYDGIKKLSNEELMNDNLLVQQLGETETVHMVKENRRNSAEATSLIHTWQCHTLKDIVRVGLQHRNIGAICRKIFIAKYLRIQKLFTQHRTIFNDGPHNKLKLANGIYKEIFRITSKEFRSLIKGKIAITRSKFCEQLDLNCKMEYLNQIKRLQNTRHKNTLLRIWNGDCLSNSRLFHYGLVETNTCPNCNNYDSAEHMLFECDYARQVWENLQGKIMKNPSATIVEYAMGINDSRSYLMVKAEILKYVMHFRHLQPEQVVNRAINYIKLTNRGNLVIAGL